MAQAKQIGKIVITQNQPVAIRADASYLITGGLGGLGLRVARWLADRAPPSPWRNDDPIPTRDRASPPGYATDALRARGDMALSGTFGSIGLADVIGFLSTHGGEGILTIRGATTLRMLIMPRRIVVADGPPGRARAKKLDARLARATRESAEASGTGPTLRTSSSSAEKPVAAPMSESR